MRAFASAALALVLTLSAAPPSMAAASEGAATAQAKVSVTYGEWSDAAREGRKTPYKLYLPAGPGPFPVVVHSHGLGGSREASAYILQAVAEAGFAVVALQHAGSDSAVLAGVRPGQEQALLGRMPPDAAANRFRDIPFALDQLTRMTAPGGSLAGKLDMTRVGMSGHSFGALATLVAVGQALPDAPPEALREPRIKAAIAYSPNKPRQGATDVAFAAVRTPILHFTGTEDSTPLDLENTPWERTIPFQRINGADQFLIVLHGGDHAVFSGRRQVTGAPKPSDAAQIPVIVNETVTFWRAYLGGDQASAKALCDLPATVRPVADGYVKAKQCGAPTPIKSAEAS